MAIIGIDRHAYLAAYNSGVPLHVSEPPMDYLGLWHRADTAGITVQEKAQEDYFQITEWSEHGRNQMFMLEARPQLGHRLDTLALTVYNGVRSREYLSPTSFFSGAQPPLLHPHRSTMSASSTAPLFLKTPSIAFFHLDLHTWVVKNGYTFCFP